MKFYSIIFAGLLLAAATLRAEVNVVASLPDFGSIAETIGGKEVQVTTIARGSEDPHFVDARPSFVRVLNKADLLIESGAELEVGWLPTLVTASRNAKIQAGGKGHLALARHVKLLDVPTGPVDRSMGDVHPTGNPHFWLDPRNGKIIAQRIAEKLRELDPKNAAVYDKNLAAFSANLDEKWTEWQKKMEPLRKTKVITYHKSYEYFAAAFGLEVVAQLEPKPGIEPSATHIAQLVQRAKEAGVRMVIIEPYRPRRSAEQLASAIGAVVVVLPEKTGAVPEAKDYFSLFDSIVKKLTESGESSKLMADTLLRLERLAVGYGGQPVLKDLNAEIAPGDSIGLLGANGSGKTTLLKTIAGVLSPLAGQVIFPGRSKRPVVGFVPQRESLEQPFLLSSLEVVLMGACGRIGPGKFLGAAERSRAAECLEKTGAGSLGQQRFAELSGGQKQRVLIARALMATPDLLLLDEPTAGVDNAATKAIADLLLKLNGEKITIVMVTHDLPVVRRVVRRIFWVRDGGLEQGDAAEMLNAARREELPIE